MANTIVGPQIIPSIRKGVHNTGSLDAQDEMGKRVSGIEFKEHAQPYDNQSNSSPELPRISEPDDMLEFPKDLLALDSRDDARISEDYVEEKPAQGEGSAADFVIQSPFEKLLAAGDFGAHRKAQVREIDMLKLNRAEEGYAGANAIFGDYVMGRPKPTVGVRLIV